jgi:hypothetical protein
MGGAHQTWCGWPKPQALATPSALNNTGTRDTAETKVKTGRGPIMEEVLWCCVLWR